jgi:hypothetical protein
MLGDEMYCMKLSLKVRIYCCIIMVVVILGNSGKAQYLRVVIRRLRI